MKNIIKISFASLVIFFLTLSSVNAGWNNFRDYETIIITGQRVPEFLNVSVDLVYIYSYDQNTNEWRQITFQIDEKDNGSDYFITPNQVIDSNDEILFMAKDAGDKAEPTRWIEDEESRQYVRYEFEIADPLDAGQKKYVYIYRSSLLTSEPTLPVYMDYVSRTQGYSDTVRAAGYIEGHNERGVPNTWKIPVAAGGNGLDILDRQKARVNGKYKIGWFTKDIKLTENNLGGDGIQIKTGPIRTIRDIKYKTTISGITITVGTFKYSFYPYNIVALGTTKILTSEYNISLIRQSFDLNTNAVGMLFNNYKPENSDIIIDGSSDVVIKDIDPSPEVNWYMCSGAPGTFVMINEFTPPANANYRLYYYDSLGGGTDDGTGDTGTAGAYGDTGILYTGSKIEGQFSLPYVTYFLPANQSAGVGLTMVDYNKNPLTVIPVSENYTPPEEIAISLPDTTIPEQMTINVPIIIGNLKEQDITSCQLTVQFDSSALSINGVSSLNTLVENWEQPVINLASDSIDIFLLGSIALQDSGTLIYLTITAIGTEGLNSPLHFNYAQFNLGDPIAILGDGSCTITAPLHVTISLPDTSAIENSSITVPITIDDVTGMNVKSCHLEIQYSKYILFAESVSVQGTKSQEWSVNAKYNIGLLTLDLSGENPLSESGTLIKIVFNVRGSSGQTSSLHFKRAIFSGGAPVAIPQDGQILVTGLPLPELQVSISDSTKQSGSLLRLPIKVSSLTGLDIYNYRINLSFADNVLDFRGLDISGSITEMWGEPVVSDFGDNIMIGAFGTIPLQGAGSLIYLNFNVIGIDGSSSVIHFDNMAVSSTSVLLITNDGTIFVEGVVPVELSSFSADYNNNSVILNWTTQTETNNYGFYIQRKQENNLDWETIGFVKGVGTTIIPQSYQFIDRDVQSGKWFYRLSQQDMDGAINFSHSIEIEILVLKGFSLKQNYPNPFNSSTIISYELSENGKEVNLQIYNLKGHLIRKLVQNEIQNSGNHQVIWDGRDQNGKRISSGVYYYQLQAGKVNISKKMVLIE